MQLIDNFYVVKNWPKRLGGKLEIGLQSRHQKNLCFKAKRWICNNHFGELANDSTGNSRSATKWESLLITDCDYFPECDTNIKWSDITMALSDALNNKAPGPDGIPSELWKLEVSEKIPESKMAKIIFKIINVMYDSDKIPTNMDINIVVPVPKMGDMKDPDDYQGILLITTLSKLSSKIIATKLAQIDKKYEILVKEQAGFRNFEECAAQATTIYEISWRRKIKNKKTFINYIDYSKAYYRVLHTALLYKLKAIGIGGKLLNSIWGLYRTPKIAGIQGVYVPGITSRIPGLLFADDADLLAESEVDMHIALNEITDWSNTCEITVNASKCGLMNDAGPQSSDLILKTQNIPKTDQYTYLGYIINYKWDVSGTIKKNKLKAR
ncbi:Retrovirus-related Pol polyprotein from type-2 retrotransposable element R2DM [Smittium mucronatum]|uniref:Retrovirus-related Pol polyprotein from type-2 retrotransposable element R2DM n=1 Tax=Smittium mucronatum TaxID=133383 RepID=A0A1R0GY01_9FUNG|nr:Retrovirus-related Pol polyprotein from type-2 retrotransposable element R2DM [Smittium mucronatum]